jgi:hypothetical protein
VVVHHDAQAARRRQATDNLRAFDARHARRGLVPQLDPEGVCV